MTAVHPASYRRVAEAAWQWVLDQVRWDDGPWVPTEPGSTAEVGPGWDRDGLHSGIAGLALVLAEIRLARSWSTEERVLAEGIADRLRRVVPGMTDCTFFDGLVAVLGALVSLEADGVRPAVTRLAELAEPDGWPQTVLGAPGYLPGTRINDLTLGTAGVLLGSIWACRHGVADAEDVAARAVETLLAEAEPEPAGTGWPMVPTRFRTEGPGTQMPNLSHGVAGIATALALAGVELGRSDATAAAVSGAEHLVSLGARRGAGFVVPRYLAPGPRQPQVDDRDVSYGWCHGASGTSVLFLALDRAGVPDVAGEHPLVWHRRCLHSVRSSGVPARLHPGFWDNDGRCCGTAGVGEVFLDSWQRTGLEEDLDFALRLADTLVERAVVDGEHAYWRFIDADAVDPLLPPGVGWMQGAAGIAAYLFRVGRVSEQGRATSAVARMDTWWALPPLPGPG